MASATDTFNRTDGALSGSTLSDGVNTWSVTGGSWAVFSNRIEWAAPGGVDYVAWVNSLPDCATQTVSVQFLSSTDIGVVARYNVTSGVGTFYMAWSSGGTYVLGKYINGSTFTTLGTGGTYALGDTVTLDCNGTSLTVKQNGSTIITATDGTITTGKAGLYAGGDANSKIFDDFAFTGTADAGGGSAASAKVNAGLLVPFTRNRLLGL